jgi:UDP-N-acetylmuramoyl-L-alanyl-D-glutamate--2,6-diaminopimelate ligase
MQLNKILAGVAVQRSEGELAREVLGIVHDSRRVKPGMAFVAVKGLECDGHDYISDAIDRGAVAIICERNGFQSHRATKVVVSDTRAAMARMANTFFDHPSRKLKVIGITGTNGKTTSAFTLKRLLEAQGIRTGLISTVHYELGDRVLPASLTTPESLELQALLAEMVQAGCQACVMEVSSHAMMQERVAGVEFDVGVFTNLSQDHLDYHRTMEDYFAAKRAFFRLVEKNPNAIGIVINADDVYGQRLIRDAEIECISYGIDNECRLRSERIELRSDGSLFELHTGQGIYHTRLAPIGRHNIYNSMAALGVIQLLGASVDKAVADLQKIAPVPGRLEKIQAGQNFDVVVDYAHTSDALANVLTTLRELTSGRVLVTFGCGGCRDIGKRIQMGEVAARLAHQTIVTSDNPRKEAAAAIAAQIQAGYRKVRADGCLSILDRHAAISEVIHRALPGDTVLIAGKGHESFQELADAVIPFDDRRHAVQILREMATDRLTLHAA